jgi:hypothetical protein
LVKTQHISSQAQVVWPIVGQEIFDVGEVSRYSNYFGSFNYGAQVVLQANFNFTQLRLAV